MELEYLASNEVAGCQFGFYRGKQAKAVCFYLIIVLLQCWQHIDWS